MLLRRLIAELIDIAVLVGGSAIGIFLAGQLNGMFEEPFFLLTISEVCLIALIPIMLQSLFWLDHTTIGKRWCFVPLKQWMKLN